MYTCKLCNKQFENGRGFHCHLLRFHEKDYKEAGYKKELFMNSVEPATEERIVIEIKKRPDGLRLLRMQIEEEAAARRAGFLLVDNDENLYKEETAKAKGWI